MMVTLEDRPSDSQHRTLVSEVVRRFRRHTVAMGGLAIILVFVVLAVAAPLVAPHSPVEMHPYDALAAPSRTHPLGTDELGRDLLSRVIYGSRTSFSVGIISVGLSLVAGTILGLVSGYRLGMTDSVISRAVDVLYAFPPVLLVLVFVALLGTGTEKSMLAIGIVFIPAFARLCRGSVIGERGKLYVEAATAVGASDLRILVSHVLPNVSSPLIVQTSLCMSYAILVEAELSYLGLGTQPPNPSWGVMLNTGRGLMDRSPWISIWAGLAIMLVVFAFNVVGDGLRDALDPRLRRAR
jgi:peptide/nickel transport system permease protein